MKKCTAVQSKSYILTHILEQNVKFENCNSTNHCKKWTNVLECILKWYDILIITDILKINWFKSNQNLTESGVSEWELN